MGTTLANIHIYHGDLNTVSTLYPDDVVGQWGDDVVSVFSETFLPEIIDYEAKNLSKKLDSIILSAWLFDGDAVSISLFSKGKTVACHTLNPFGHSKMGNIPLFCKTLGLPPEDSERLHVVWQKASAEDQISLTGSLLGLPLFCDEELLPDEPMKRDEADVDRWIVDHPDLPKIKNTARAVILQEIPKFRLHGIAAFHSDCYVSDDPWDTEMYRDRSHIWRADPDGSISKRLTFEGELRFYGIDNRLIAVNTEDERVEFDSDSMMVPGRSGNLSMYYLDDGRTVAEVVDDGTVACCAPDGHELWRKTYDEPLFVAANERNMLIRHGDEILRVDMDNGEIIQSHSGVLGPNVFQKDWHDGVWYFSHDGGTPPDGEEYSFMLTKTDGDLNVLAETRLPLYTQTLFFSPDRKILYVFIFEELVLALDAETLQELGRIRDKEFLSPLGFDSGMFWLQRNGNTVEAWDPLLKAPVSRHTLRGEICGCHMNADGRLCVASWHEVKSVLRIYRLLRGEELRGK